MTMMMNIEEIDLQELQFQTSVQLSQVHYLHLKPLYKPPILLGLCQRKDHVSVRQLLCIFKQYCCENVSSGWFRH